VATDVIVPKGGEIVVLFALEREAAPFRRLARELKPVQIHVTGVGRHRTRIALDQILSKSHSTSRIIAAGFCGALQAHLKVGDVVIASEVVDESGRVWAIAEDLNHIERTKHRLLTVNHLIAKATEKQRLGKLHTADVVDMESATIAETCSGRGVPFLIVRAVSDTVDTELSPELVRLLSGGNASILKACRALVRKPSLLGEFRRLARDTRLAARNLAETLLNIVRA
jgi:adenosylhomocysteine nucleosidase